VALGDAFDFAASAFAVAARREQVPTRDLVGDGDVGVVCVHGLTGTPYEMRFLGGELARAGFTAIGPLLPGHGTTVDDLARTRWSEWVAAVERAFDSLRARCERVAVVGQSMGGLLALELASRRTDVAAVATLATPLWLGRLGGLVARWAEAGKLGRIRTLPKLRGSDVRDRQVRAENPCYATFPINAIIEISAGMRAVDAALPRIVAPVLVLHGKRDHTAPVACAERIAERARAVRTLILPRSYHLIAADVERDIVAAEVIAFLRAHARTERGDIACAT
jgi:carboxylesterase